MSSDDDGEKNEADVIDMTSRIPVRVVGENNTVRLATKLALVLIQNPGTPVEHIAALGLVGRMVKELLVADGATEQDIMQVTQAAMAAMKDYRIELDLKPRKDGR